MAQRWARDYDHDEYDDEYDYEDEYDEYGEQHDDRQYPTAAVASVSLSRSSRPLPSSSLPSSGVKTSSSSAVSLSRVDRFTGFACSSLLFSYHLSFLPLSSSVSLASVSRSLHSSLLQHSKHFEGVYKAKVNPYINMQINARRGHSVPFSLIPPSLLPSCGRDYLRLLSSTVGRKPRLVDLFDTRGSDANKLEISDDGIFACSVHSNPCCINVWRVVRYGHSSLHWRLFKAWPLPVATMNILFGTKTFTDIDTNNAFAVMASSNSISLFDFSCCSVLSPPAFALLGRPDSASKPTAHSDSERMVKRIEEVKQTDAKETPTISSLIQAAALRPLLIPVAASWTVEALFIVDAKAAQTKAQSFAVCYTSNSTSGSVARRHSFVVLYSSGVAVRQYGDSGAEAAACEKATPTTDKIDPNNGTPVLYHHTRGFPYIVRYQGSHAELLDLCSGRFSRPLTNAPSPIVSARSLPQGLVTIHQNKSVILRDLTSGHKYLLFSGESAPAAVSAPAASSRSARLLGEAAEEAQPLIHYDKDMELLIVHMQLQSLRRPNHYTFIWRLSSLSASDAKLTPVPPFLQFPFNIAFRSISCTNRFLYAVSRSDQLLLWPWAPLCLYPYCCPDSADPEPAEPIPDILLNSIKAACFASSGDTLIVSHSNEGIRTYAFSTTINKGTDAKESWLHVAERERVDKYKEAAKAKPVAEEVKATEETPAAGPDMAAKIAQRQQAKREKLAARKEVAKSRSQHDRQVRE